MNRDKMIKELSRDEGRRNRAYQCTAGKTTIGVGRNLDDRGLSEDEIDYLLSNDIKYFTKEARLIFGDDFDTFSPARQRGIVNMVFNLGEEGFRKFTRTIACIKRGDWGLAADAILKSLWAKQVGERAKRISEQFRNGGD